MEVTQHPDWLLWISAQFNLRHTGLATTSYMWSQRQEKHWYLYQNFMLTVELSNHKSTSMGGFPLALEVACKLTVTWLIGFSYPSLSWSEVSWGFSTLFTFLLLVGYFMFRSTDFLNVTLFTTEMAYHISTHRAFSDDMSSFSALKTGHFFSFNVLYTIGWPCILSSPDIIHLLGGQPISLGYFNSIYIGQIWLCE